MRHSVLLVTALLVATCSGILIAQGAEKVGLVNVMTEANNREAYSQAIQPLDATQNAAFFRGRSLVRQSWIIPPSQDASIAGLGPLYNRNSCVACHSKNGRGHAPDGPQDSLRAMLVRLSLPNRTSTNAPMPHPWYGDQINEFGVNGNENNVPAEAKIQISYTETIFTFKDGEQVNLRSPTIHLTELTYGNLAPDTQFSARIAPGIYGMGLLAAIPEQQMIDLAAQAKPDGISGKVNRVWDAETQKTQLGRFGWKANIADIKMQTASALAGDMGITSTHFPNANCATKQQTCMRLNTPNEVNSSQLDDMEFYQLAVAVPKQRNTDNALVIKGAKIFKQANCAACHIPEMRTGKFPRLTPLSNVTIKPYTDLLLHNMGAGLADGRPDFLASGEEWRTPPLWGIGLAKQVNLQAGFLHDGRARTLMEAILWHGGEAENAKQRVIDMPSDERKALMKFLNSL
ncbi:MULTISPECIES: di-heme oxidoreductase family protein [Methylotenera]|uniref:di-heme oxidoreductase family protein n=1 Tax=Methylotenera TaxID=359407 RepID=UPI000363923E|nr:MULTISPECIES: di-heme oxidoredictase family protein [Methylotenera]